jgi:hypothetical protein
MPWCPRCDETFPEGPACPRCNARLIQRESESVAETIESVPALRGLTVSRRYRRALSRLSGPKGPSPRVLVAALAMLVFAVGFLLGRLASVTPSPGPTVRALPVVDPLALDGVQGSAVYALWSRDSLATVASQDLASGDVEPRLRLSAPMGSGSVDTRIVTLRSNVAFVASDGRNNSYIAFSVDGSPPHGWVDGVEAAWVSSEELLVRHRDRALTRWLVEDGAVRSEPAGRADRLWQTPTGAVVQRDGTLRNGSQALNGQGIQAPDLRKGGRVLAISGDGERALVDDGGAAIWDGTSMRRVRVDGAEVVGASFEPSGDRIALAMRVDDGLTLGISDLRGKTALKPLDAKYRDCDPIPAWDDEGKWVYASVGNGLLYAAETGGGRMKQVRTNVVGCGLAWIP